MNAISKTTKGRLCHILTYQANGPNHSGVISRIVHTGNGNFERDLKRQKLQ